MRWKSLSISRIPAPWSCVLLSQSGCQECPLRKEEVYCRFNNDLSL